MEISGETVSIVCRWEGFHKRLADGRAKPYLCPARRATIAYGATYWLDGTPVKMTDDAITEEVGKQLLIKQLESYAAAVDRTIKVKMHPYMRAAAISLCYNIGTGAFAKSTLARRINAREWAGCPEAFKRYKIGGGRVLTGLLSRRIDEAGLFMRGVAKLGEVATPSPASVKSASGPTDSSPSWWQQIVQGILDGLGNRAAVTPT